MLLYLTTMVDSPSNRTLTQCIRVNGLIFSKLCSSTGSPQGCDDLPWF